MVAEEVRALLAAEAAHSKTAEDQERFEQKTSRANRVKRAFSFSRKQKKKKRGWGGGWGGGRRRRGARPERGPRPTCR